MEARPIQSTEQSRQKVMTRICTKCLNPMPINVAADLPLVGDLPYFLQKKRPWWTAPACSRPILYPTPIALVIPNQLSPGESTILPIPIMGTLQRDLLLALHSYTAGAVSNNPLARFERAWMLRRVLHGLWTRIGKSR